MVADKVKEEKIYQRICHAIEYGAIITLYFVYCILVPIKEY
jgi:hypothetical protein